MANKCTYFFLEAQLQICVTNQLVCDITCVNMGNEHKSQKHQVS